MRSFEAKKLPNLRLNVKHFKILLCCVSLNLAPREENMNRVELHAVVCYLLRNVHVSPLNYEFLSSFFSCLSYSNRFDTFSPFLSIGKSAHLVNFVCQLSFREIINVGRPITASPRGLTSQPCLDLLDWNRCVRKLFKAP